MSTILDRIQYGFDCDSRRTWRRRVLTTAEDHAYGYDGLSQILGDARGNLNLNQTAISAVPASRESWQYDPAGNWQGYETQADGSVTLDQHRVYDKGNRLTQIEGEPNPILLDRAGRMRQVPPDATGEWDESLELKWDAWGRITQVKRVSDSEVLGSYAYDGLSRRTTREVGGVVQHSYYSDAWRVLEERKDSATTAAAQYLWGVRHRDDLARRDRDVNGDGDLDETRYVLMDYYAAASITDETGEVKERYDYSAFGLRRILAPDWSSRSTSECAWTFGFQGQFLDEESGFMNYGYRYYSPYLGRWLSKDPAGEQGGLNLYAFAENRPTNTVDHLGLSPDPPDCCKTEMARAQALSGLVAAAQKGLAAAQAQLKTQTHNLSVAEAALVGATAAVFASCYPSSPNAAVNIVRCSAAIAAETVAIGKAADAAKAVELALGGVNSAEQLLGNLQDALKEAEEEEANCLLSNGSK